MKILYIDDIPTPYRLDIHRQFLLESDDVYRVLFCASEEPGRSWELDLSGLNYEILKGIKFRPPGQVNPFSFKFNPGIVAALRAYQPDVVVLSGYVHPTMWLAATWCRRNAVPYGITSESSRDTASNSYLKGLLKNTIIGPVLKGVSFGLPVSRAAGAHMRELAGNNTLPIYQFPNTPDINAIQAVIDASTKSIEDRRDLTELGVPPDGKIILFVGRLIDAKRPLDLLAAYQCLPQELREQAHLVFVGDGPLRDKITAASKNTVDSDFSIFDVGWISDQEQLARIIASADLFVLPSSHEPWGAVVNQALACGLPVLASDRVGAAQDMISDGKNGFVFECGRVERLSELIGLFLRSADQQEYKVAARKTAREFGEVFAVKNMMAALNYAVSTKKDDNGCH